MMNLYRDFYNKETTATIGGSYRKYWLEIQNLILSLENKGINVVAPNKEWEPKEDDEGSVKFKGEEETDIANLELNFLYNMVSSDIFVICNPNNYVGYMAYAEFLLAYYVILNKTLESKIKRELLNALIKHKGQEFYDRHYQEYRNLLIGKDFIDEIRKRGQKVKLNHIYFTEAPIGLNYFDENGLIKENFVNEFFSSSEFARDREYYNAGLFDINDGKGKYNKNIYSNRWPNFEMYIHIMQKQINLIQDGIKRGIVTIGTNDLIKSSKKTLIRKK